METQLSNTIKKRSRWSTGKKGSLELLILALPAIIWVFIFLYIPMGGLMIAFKDYNYADGIFGSPWCGFKNFEFMFKSSDFTRILSNTAFYNFVFIIVGHSFAIFVALLLDATNSRRSVKLFQTTFFLPYFISWVVVALIGRLILDYDNGFLNQILRFFGKEGVIWYQTPKPWRVILPLFNLWKTFAYSAIIYYGTIMGINQEIYEAASIDGCGKLKSVWYITLPQLKPTIIILLIMAIGSVLRADFGLFYQVTGDNSLIYSTTDVIDTYLFRSLTVTGDLGISSAVGFFQSVVGFFLVICTNYVVNKVESSYALF